MSNFPSYHHYDEITMMYIDPEDRKYLARAHATFTPAMAPVQPIAKRTRSRVAALKKTIAFKKKLPELRRLQAAARAEAAQREAAAAVGNLDPHVPVHVPSGYHQDGNSAGAAEDR
jgi:hypothetical protein